MGPDINERIEREAEYFDHKQFQREGYEAALAYLNNGIGRQRRNDVVRASMQEATGKRVLEIATEVVDSATNPLLRIPEELAKPPVTRRRGRVPRHTLENG